MNDVPGSPPYLARDWLGLRWSAWMPLMAAHPLALAQLPSESGLFRIRRVDRNDRLIWAGPAEQGVRQTVERLSRQVHMPVAPYDDPRGPALRLWRLRHEGRLSFEVSGAAKDGRSLDSLRKECDFVVDGREDVDP